MFNKKKVFELLDDSERDQNKWNRFISAFIIALILLSILQVILESFKEIHFHFSSQFFLFEVIITILFTIEYGLRVWISDLKHPELSKARARLKFITSAMGLIDLVAILPFYLPFFFRFDLRFIRILRVVRLLRIFKLTRYTKAMELAAGVFFEKRTELGITIFVTFNLLLLSSTVMYNLETEVQPDKFPNIISTFWWAIATLTTVGYGDVYPVTGMGKLISGIIALLGIGLVALPTGIISSGFIEKIERNKKDQQDPVAFKFCPHCGKPLNYEKIENPSIKTPPDN